MKSKRLDFVVAVSWLCKNNLIESLFSITYGHWSLCSTYWSDNDWAEIFLNALEAKVFQSLKTDGMCWGTHSVIIPAIHNWVGTFTSCLHSLKFSQKWEFRGFLILSFFLSHENLHGFLDSQEEVGAFQKLYSPKHLIPQPFLPKFYGWSIKCNSMSQAGEANTFDCKCLRELPPCSCFSSSWILN